MNSCTDGQTMPRARKTNFEWTLQRLESIVALANSGKIPLRGSAYEFPKHPGHPRKVAVTQH